MNADDPYLDVLQNIEASVMQVWRAHPEMTDYVAQRAYEAAFQQYRNESRGGTPKPHGLRGLDAETFEAVKEACEFRLGRPSKLAEAVKGKPEPVPIEAMVDCLRKLGRSVEFNTRNGGRQGYLKFVERFVR